MKAWVLHNKGDLRFEQIPIPKIKNGEVLVKVSYAGICSSDIPRIFETGAYRYPIILGHEFSGIVESTGKRVGVFPLIPCFKCECCLGKKYETCSNYSYIGSRQNGAFAEYVAVPEWNLIEIPKTISMEQAALLEPAAVALHAVKNADLKNVSNAAVFGRGIIGKLVSAWLNVYGIEINPKKADICFEAVGKADVLKSCIETVKPNGQIILIGNPNTEFKIEQNLYWQILRKQLKIKGTWNSSYPKDWQETIKAMQENKLKLTELITHKYQLSNLSEALEMIRLGKEYRCKVMLKNDQ